MVVENIIVGGWLSDLEYEKPMKYENCVSTDIKTSTFTVKQKQNIIKLHICILIYYK